MAYCDYDFYTNKYLGNVITEADFPRLSERASEKLDRLTFDRLSMSEDGTINASIVHTTHEEIEPLDEKTSTRVKKAVCKIAEILNDIELYEKASRELAGYEQTENGQRGKVITSVSSGSESISYSVKESSNSIVGAVLTDKKAQERLFYDIAVEYLSGTGLLYAGF